jgi:hypothetical protein
VSLGQRFERRLEGMVGSAFARVFKGQVEPVEIGEALRREASDKRAVMGNGQVLSPNRYRVTLGDSDYERLAPWEAQLAASLAELVQEHLDENSLQTIGDIEVFLAHDAALHTGVFGIASRMEPQAPPRRRPYDSMSMPVVPGHPEEYLSPYGSPPPPPPVPAYQPPVPSYQPPGYGAGAPHEDPYDAPYAEPPRYREPARAPEPPPYVEPPRRPAFRARLVVDGTSQVLDLAPGSNVIGRSPESDLQLLDQGVSRRHVDVHVADGRAALYDLGSTNGTSVNGHTVQSQELQHGDVIRLGHSRLIYHQDGS